MKHFLTTLLLATLCASGYGQTIKTLGYNTNGRVVYAGTNVLNFTNSVRANRMEIENELFFFDETSVTFDGVVYFGTMDFQDANAAGGTRTNLGLGATWLTNTNVTNFRTAIGLGATNDVTFKSVSVDEVTIGGTVSHIFIGDSDGLKSVFEFDGGAEQSIARTNLGIPLPALTNTSNVTMMRALAGSTNTNTPFSGNIDIVDGNEDIHNVTISNGIILDWQAP